LSDRNASMRDIFKLAIPLPCKIRKMARGRRT
jgi:hypothetical protein